ncbi:hypothetical protein PSAC2689_80331 [Paraburkholderia sacchari]
MHMLWRNITTDMTYLTHLLWVTYVYSRKLLLLHIGQ